MFTTSEPAFIRRHLPKFTFPSFAVAESKTSWHFLILLIAATLVMLPIMIIGIPKGGDLVNHLRYALPFHDALKAGNLHPAWLADSGYGLGDPRFTFYPPGFYYLLSATRWVTGTWLSAFTLSFLVLTIAGGVGAYFWARTTFDKKIATWAGVLYIIAPYRLNEVYQASLLSEYAACSILPFAFAFVERICRRKSKLDIVGLGACYALLIATHVPLAVIGSLSLAIYALLRIERIELWATLKRLTLGAALGLAASSFYWTSVLAELSWIKGSGHDPNPYYDYRLNFVFSPSALTNRNTWYANMLALVVLAFLLPGAIYFVRSWRKAESSRTLIAVFFTLLVTFLMATSLSRPIWAITPKLAEIQFPWRWFSITSLMGALLVAAGLRQWREQFRTNLRPRDLALALAFVLSMVFVGKEVIYDCEFVKPATFETLAHDARIAPSIKDWLPVWSNDFITAYKMKAQAAAGTRDVAVTSWNPERRTFQLNAGTETNLQVRTYFYPHWTATADGRVLPVSPNAEGLLQISVPKEATQVDLTFQRTTRARLFEVITVMSWLLIVAASAWSAIRLRLRRRPTPSPAVAQVAI